MEKVVSFGSLVRNEKNRKMKEVGGDEEAVGVSDGMISRHKSLCYIASCNESFV
jgi:hypothetical protein